MEQPSTLPAIQGALLMDYHVHFIHDYTVNQNGEIEGLQVDSDKLHILRDFLGKHGWVASVQKDLRKGHVVTLRPEKYTCKVGDS